MFRCFNPGEHSWLCRWCSKGCLGTQQKLVRVETLWTDATLLRSCICCERVWNLLLPGGRSVLVENNGCCMRSAKTKWSGMNGYGNIARNHTNQQTEDTTMVSHVFLVRVMKNKWDTRSKTALAIPLCRLFPHYMDAEFVENCDCYLLWWKQQLAVRHGPTWLETMGGKWQVTRNRGSNMQQGFKVATPHNLGFRLENFTWPSAQQSVPRESLEIRKVIRKVKPRKNRNAEAV